MTAVTDSVSALCANCDAKCLLYLSYITILPSAPSAILTLQTRFKGLRILPEAVQLITG
jgi:hypothetical protein